MAVAALSRGSGAGATWHRGSMRPLASVTVRVRAADDSGVPGPVAALAWRRVMIIVSDEPDSGPE
jgi:hypothetical protein